MRRTALTIVGLVTVSLGTLPLAHSANAADGVLVVNGTPHPHPSGCYEGGSRPLKILNQTDQYAYVFSQPGCTGLPVSAIPPRASGVRDGLSVLIS